ncbi:GNAT family N-acetyltransferase [Pseudomonas sp. ESBL9]|uniref:GNAT family N-acetyltransferase n=1 Tax=Pseudomonas sp. ESBL9 TaxID=3077327 RepID=UPI002FC625E7
MKTVRLQALLDAPKAFGVSYKTAITYTDERWKELASSERLPHFWLALDRDEPVGMIGAGVDQTGHFNLIGMWLNSKYRGSGVAEHLVNAVKARAIDMEYQRVILNVSPDNLRAFQFYKKQGFVFIDEFEELSSHPHIKVQTMEWVSMA